MFSRGMKQKLHTVGVESHHQCVGPRIGVHDHIGNSARHREATGLPRHVRVKNVFKFNAFTSLAQGIDRHSNATRTDNGGSDAEKHREGVHHNVVEGRRIRSHDLFEGHTARTGRPIVT